MKLAKVDEDDLDSMGLTQRVSMHVHSMVINAALICRRKGQRYASIRDFVVPPVQVARTTAAVLLHALIKSLESFVLGGLFGWLQAALPQFGVVALSVSADAASANVLLVLMLIALVASLNGEGLGVTLVLYEKCNLHQLARVQPFFWKSCNFNQEIISTMYSATKMRQGQKHATAVHKGTEKVMTTAVKGNYFLGVQPPDTYECSLEIREYICELVTDAMASTDGRPFTSRLSLCIVTAWNRNLLSVICYWLFGYLELELGQTWTV